MKTVRGLSRTRTVVQVARKRHGKDAQEAEKDSVPDPTVGQIVALTGALGVEPSYCLIDRGESPIDGVIVEAPRNGTIRGAALEVVLDARLRLTIGRSQIVIRDRDSRLSESWYDDQLVP